MPPFSAFVLVYILPSFRFPIAFYFRSWSLFQRLFQSMTLTLTSKPHYEVLGNRYHHFIVSNSRILDPPFLVFWDELRYHPSTAVWSAYTTIEGGLV